ncbi:MAG TPA: hypothetical protein VMG98_02665 [Verrucomicrobiae bacterium]|nr:hypothetical protein [Verrucomicrobiae bacterium]
MPAAAGTTHRQYVSAGTESITVNDQSYNTSASSPGCSSTSAGLMCSLAVLAPAGTNVPFTVTAYAGPLGSNGLPTGATLSVGSTTATIVAGTANVVEVTLAGTPATVTLTLANPAPPMGTAATIPMTVTAADAAGYSIVGPYSSAIQITTNALSGLSYVVDGQSTQTALLTSSSDTISLAYTGTGFRTATIQANLQFAASGTYIGSATLTPTPGFGTELSVGTSLVNASAFRDSSSERRTWFSEPAKGKLAMYPSGGSITEYATPSGSSPLRITGTALNIYFTESNNYVGLYYQLSGSIMEQALTTANAGAYEVYPEPQSVYMYVTEENTGGVAYDGSTPNTLFSTGASPSTPAGIAFASSTTFWVADPAANTVDLMTTAGGFTSYQVPSANAEPTEITQNDETSNGGHWWFTEPGVSKIASLDQNGNIVEYPSPGVPVAIVATQTDIWVLTTAHLLEDFNPANGALYGTYTPPSSSNGNAVWIDDGGFGDLIVLRSNGTQGSIQELYYD